MASASRQLRRQQMRQEARYAAQMQAASSNAQKAALFRNGITFADVEKEYKRGWDDGKKTAEEFAFHAIYAAVLLVMTENHGWEPDDAADLLREIDHEVVLCVEDADLAKEAYRKTGVELKWDDPLERVQ